MRDHNIYLIDLPLLIVLVSLVYSATRYDEWGPILYEAVRWGGRLVGFLGAIAVLLYAATVGGLPGTGIAGALATVFGIFYWLTRGR
jgi:hypothetical protein